MPGVFFFMGEELCPPHAHSVPVLEFVHAVGNATRQLRRTHLQHAVLCHHKKENKKTFLEEDRGVSAAVRTHSPPMKGQAPADQAGRVVATNEFKPKLRPAAGLTNQRRFFENLQNASPDPTRASQQPAKHEPVVRSGQLNPALFRRVSFDESLASRLTETQSDQEGLHADVCQRKLSFEARKKKIAGSLILNGPSHLSEEEIKERERAIALRIEEQEAKALEDEVQAMEAENAELLETIKLETGEEEEEELDEEEKRMEELLDRLDNLKQQVEELTDKQDPEGSEELEEQKEELLEQQRQVKEELEKFLKKKTAAGLDKDKGKGKLQPLKAAPVSPRTASKKLGIGRRRSVGSPHSGGRTGN